MTFVPTVTNLVAVNGLAHWLGKTKEETVVNVGQIMAVGATREKYGHYSTILQELRTEDDVLYDELLQRIQGRIEKDTWYRKSLLPSLKLSITLRYLACGDSY